MGVWRSICRLPAVDDVWPTQGSRIPPIRPAQRLRPRPLPSGVASSFSDQIDRREPIMDAVTRALFLSVCDACVPYSGERRSEVPKIIEIVLAGFVGDMSPNPVFHGILSEDSGDYDWGITAGAGSISFIRGSRVPKPSLETHLGTPARFQWEAAEHRLYTIDEQTICPISYIWVHESRADSYVTQSNWTTMSPWFTVSYKATAPTGAVRPRSVRPASA
jgi:hypothetical protein